MTKTIIDQMAEDRAEPVVDANSIDLDMAPVDAILSPDSLYDPKLKAMYDAEPKKRVYIPTPEGWREAYPYAERIEINGLKYIVVAEQDTLLPMSVAAVWDNKRAMEREVNRQTNALRKMMNYTNIDQVPHWYR